MKKITLSLMTIACIGTSLMAESYPADGPNSYKALHGKKYSHATSIDPNRGIYLGIGYSFMRDSGEVTYLGQNYSGNIDGNAATFVVGYDFNQNLAIEARYNTVIGDISYDVSGLSGDIDADVSNMSLFLKPKVTIEKTTLYALIGYGQVEVEDTNDEDFQWGFGANYHLNQTTDLFIDYTNLYNEEGNLFGISTKDNLHVFSFGITYHFSNI